MHDKGTIVSTRASVDPCLLRVPPVSEVCANTFLGRAFMYNAPMLCNTLNFDIRILAVDSLKKSRHIFI